MKKALFIASWDIGHVKELLKYLGQEAGDEIIIDAFDTSRNNEDKTIEEIHSSYHVRYGIVAKRVLPIRKIGVLAHHYSMYKALVRILRQNRYDYAAIVSVPSYTWLLVKLLHHYHVKVHLLPIGSDVLRISTLTSYFLKKGFRDAEFVNYAGKNAAGSKVANDFKVPDYKYTHCGFGSSVITMLNKLHRNDYTKEALAQVLNIPVGKYIIACGYAGNREQRHKEMLNAIANNRALLPQDYQIIVQLTYGSDKKALYSELSEQAKELGLNVVFLRDFLTVESMVMLRFYVDLFIHVQTTDAYNFSLQEYLLAGTQCINGAWLQYPRIEQDGIPYHQCETIQDLPNVLNKVLTGQLKPIILSDSARKAISRRDWMVAVDSWRKIFDQI